MPRRTGPAPQRFAAVRMGPGHFRVLFDGPVEIAEGLFLLFLKLIRDAAIVIDVGDVFVVRRVANRLRKVLDRFGVLLPFPIDNAAPVVRFEQIRRERDGFVEFGQCRVEIVLLDVNPTSVRNGLCVFRFELQRLVVIGQGEIVPRVFVVMVAAHAFNAAALAGSTMGSASLRNACTSLRSMHILTSCTPGSITSPSNTPTISPLSFKIGPPLFPWLSGIWVSST